MLLKLFLPNQEMDLGKGFAASRFAEENFSVLQESFSLETVF